ncbi:MAG: hypothetical protein KDD99_14390 [Bacteroidetes bacterium]|nr:hypothetical protein [Bacteroidota bacterium]
MKIVENIDTYPGKYNDDQGFELAFISVEPKGYVLIGWSIKGEKSKMISGA